MRHPVVENDLDEILAEPLEWERFNAKRVLVTGASEIGRASCRERV